MPILGLALGAVYLYLELFQWKESLMIETSSTIGGSSI